MIELTIEEGIQRLSELGQQIGFGVKLTGWYLGREDLKPCDRLSVAAIMRGHKDDTNERIACIHLIMP